MAHAEVLHAVLAEIHGDPVEPRRELGVAAEGADGLEDLDEDVLRQVLRFLLVADHAREQAHDAAFVALHELVEGALVPRDEAVDQPGIGIVGERHVWPSCTKT